MYSVCGVESETIDPTLENQNGWPLVVTMLFATYVQFTPFQAYQGGHVGSCEVTGVHGTCCGQPGVIINDAYQFGKKL